MNHLRAITLAGWAVIGYLGGRLTENEMRVTVSEARALIGRPPVTASTTAGTPPQEPRSGVPLAEMDARLTAAITLARRWHERAQANPDATLTYRMAADSFLHELNGLGG